MSEKKSSGMSISATESVVGTRTAERVGVFTGCACRGKGASILYWFSWDSIPLWASFLDADIGASQGLLCTGNCVCWTNSAAYSAFDMLRPELRGILGVDRAMSWVS